MHNLVQLVSHNEIDASYRGSSYTPDQYSRVKNDLPPLISALGDAMLPRRRGTAVALTGGYTTAVQ